MYAQLQEATCSLVQWTIHNWHTIVSQPCIYILSYKNVPLINVLALGSKVLLKTFVLYILLEIDATSWVGGSIQSRQLPAEVALISHSITHYVIYLYPHTLHGPQTGQLQHSQH